MAASSSSLTMLLSPPNPSLYPSSSTRNTLFSVRTTFLPKIPPIFSSSAAAAVYSTSPSTTTRRKSFLVSAAAAGALQALIFDCDGVILESEHLHRQAYNDAFSHFNVRCSSAALDPLNWGLEFYDELQNRIGGGKPKMRWYFGEHGWPSSTIFETPPKDNKDREKLIDIIQDWKTERYKEIIKSGTVEPRPGVLRLMDEAKAAGKQLAVCSAATKSSVILCLENLIGIERFQGLDCFLAGDDVKEKKLDPSIYLTAAKKLGVSGGDFLVVEDSVIGLQEILKMSVTTFAHLGHIKLFSAKSNDLLLAATGAGMPCIITFTSSTANQEFKEAIAKYPDLGDVRLRDLEILLQSVVTAN